MVLYVPVIRAPPLPPLRASAYASGASLIGPVDDPTGWQALPNFRVRVAWKGHSEACEVECTARIKAPISILRYTGSHAISQVYIANPTAYTRGSVIPCFLHCKTSDTCENRRFVLHSFVAQKCVLLDLLQRVQYPHDSRSAAGTGTSSGGSRVGHGRKTDGTANLEEGGTAVWWAPHAEEVRSDAHPSESENYTSELTLEGELHIDVALLPTCKVPFLEVSVSWTAALLPSLNGDY